MATAAAILRRTCAAISRGELTAIIFYLKTQGKRSGYIERHAVDLVQISPEVVDKMSDDQLRRLAAGEPLAYCRSARYAVARIQTRPPVPTTFGIV